MPRLVTASVFRPSRAASLPAGQSATRKAAASRTPYVGMVSHGVRMSSGNIRRLPLLGTEEIEQQESAADHDRGVRDVEGVPVVGAEVEIEEVGDAAPHDAVK